jgi:hypothetical protein
MSFGGSIMAGAGDDYNINVNVNLAPAQAQMAQFGQMISGMTAQASQSAAAMGAAFQTSMNTVVSQGAAAGQTMTGLNTQNSDGDDANEIVRRSTRRRDRAVRRDHDARAVRPADRRIVSSKPASQMDQMGDKSLKFKQSLQDIQAMSGAPGEVAPQDDRIAMQLIRMWA